MRPSRPSAIAFARKMLVSSKRLWLMTLSKMPASPAMRMISRASCTVVAMGFSTCMCLPASAQSRTVDVRAGQVIQQHLELRLEQILPPRPQTTRVGPPHPLFCEDCRGVARQIFRMPRPSSNPNARAALSFAEPALCACGDTRQFHLPSGRRDLLSELTDSSPAELLPMRRVWLPPSTQHLPWPPWSTNEASQQQQETSQIEKGIAYETRFLLIGGLEAQQQSSCISFSKSSL